MRAGLAVAVLVSSGLVLPLPAAAETVASAGSETDRVGTTAAGWTRFRGPDGAGVSPTAFPTQWDDYAWQVTLPGKGHSSPVVFGDRVFVTAGTDNGGRHLLALAVSTGQTIWQRTVALPPSHLHSKNSLASGTPACDAERVYVPVASAGAFLLVAFSHDGEELWRQPIGTYESQHGPGSSPIVHDGLVVIANDQIGPSAVVAFDAATGQLAWTSPRTSRRAAYSTPISLPGRADVLLCLSGAEGVTGVSAADGRRLFASGAVPLRVVASPVVADGAVIITCGSGGRGKYLAAIDPVPPASEGDPWTVRTRWERKQLVPYVPTPIAYEGSLYFWNDNGVVCCVDPASGQDRWKVRVGGNYSGSPVIAGGRLYILSEQGRVAVVDAVAPEGGEPTVHPGGAIPIGSHATPAIADGRMFLRGFGTLSMLPAEDAVKTAAD